MAQRSIGAGNIHLFRLFGVNVYLHWSWFLVAIWQLQLRRAGYSHIFYPIVEYLTLFLIVLMHEFGHALACRSVGGVAERIILWPLGGVAFVSPPNRPGAWLWSIVAGPLVNVLLLAPTLALVWWVFGEIPSLPLRNASDFQQLIVGIAFINLVLLVFNMLPMYPLDGGQILRSLLWFIVGPARSLMVAAVIGLVGAAAMFFAAIYFMHMWLMLIAAFAALQSWIGFQQARQMAAALAGPRHTDLRCPACGTAPPWGRLWRCACGNVFDVFEADAVCPKCGRGEAMIPCPVCGQASSAREWFASAGRPIPYQRPPFKSPETPSS